MIKSKSDLIRYMERDRVALNVGGIRDFLFHDIWRFQRRLRKAEYWSNSNVLGSRFIAFLYRRIAYKTGRDLGFSIPINTVGAGLSIAHVGTIVINSKCKIGENCRIHVCVNIGASASNSSQAPLIGNDCYIAPGAKIYGGIVIADNTGVGANSVVNKSFLEGGITIAGIPAKKISNVGPNEFRPKSDLKE
jgi:serine O-acetyltransferase